MLLDALGCCLRFEGTKISLKLDIWNKNQSRISYDQWFSLPAKFTETETENVFGITIFLLETIFVLELEHWIH